MSKNYYFDPVLNSKQNAMKLRADIIETQLEDNAARARDIEAARQFEEEKRPSLGQRIKRFFKKKV
ncbi:MAG: hypothetical protein IKD43_04130 [Clostridia bacterium]|nr:hypothetical protein [Clostridia bacterium]